MTFARVLCIGCLAILPSTVFAGGVGNSIEAYVVSSDGGIDDPSFDEIGVGLGVRGDFAIADHVFVGAGYQAVSFDESGEDTTQVRGGIGLNSSADAAVMFYGLAEYVRMEELFLSPFDGFGLHLGARFKVAKWLALDGRVGYLELDGSGNTGDIESSGIEYVVGAKFRISRVFGLFTNYRVTALEFNKPGPIFDLDIHNFQFGMRFAF